MKTRVIVGAESAYFCAQDETRSMDVISDPRGFFSVWRHAAEFMD